MAPLIVGTVMSPDRHIRGLGVTANLFKRHRVRNIILLALLNWYVFFWSRVLPGQLALNRARVLLNLPAAIARPALDGAF